MALRTLIIGDIHNEIGRVDAVLAEYAGQCHSVIFLGDYFDSYGDGPAQMRESCLWLKDSLQNPNRIHLLGNHDVAYFINGHLQTNCPGHTAEKQAVFEEFRGSLALDAFAVAETLGPWLISHAGLPPAHTKGKTPEELVKECAEELKNAQSGASSWIFDRAQERGGRASTGGPLWLDWSGEFKPTPGIHQIVGHSQSKGVARAKCLTLDRNHRSFEVMKPSPWPRLKQFPHPAGWSSINWCIDTKLVFCGLVDHECFSLLPPN